MDDFIKEIDLNGKRYRVFHDYDGYTRISDQDFESEAQRREYLHKFETEQMFVYGIQTWSICECCGNPEEFEDSLWGIEAESEDQALEYYIQGTEVVAV
jgi:hypothetical protein